MKVLEGTKNTLGAARNLYKAVVLDVVTDPAVTPATDVAQIFEIPADPRVEKAPANSCFIGFYGPGSETIKKAIAYPFFPVHLSVPIHPGEAVWVFSPSLEAPVAEELYWMCKISGDASTNDVNFEHIFRSAGTKTNPSAPNAPIAKTSQRANQPPLTPDDPKGLIIPGFLNTQGGTPILKGLFGDAPADDNVMNPFDFIASSSVASRETVREPVPNFVKRPGDFAIQGSNNSLVWLGQDRGYSSEQMKMFNELTQSSAMAAPTEFAGTIDIVTGRSRYMGPPTVKDAISTVKERTSTKTIQNSFGFSETDTLHYEDQNVLSGDLDFDVDASRIYVSMKTDGDKNFALTNEFNRLPAAIVTGSIQPVSQSAYIIAKSDEIRIIARKQLENEYYSEIGNPEINGSIKIIKEGAKDDDLASVMLLPDGTIQISGSRIFLGRHPDDGGKDEGGAGPEDAAQSQPYVRYKQLEDLLNAILDNIDAFCDTLNTHVTPGYGSPSPQILEAAATLKTEVATRKSEIETLKSERIFGE